MSAQADLYNLQSINAIEFNQSIVNDSTNILFVVFDVTKNEVGNLWFMVSIWGLWFFFNWLFFRREENFGYDIARSLLISSGFCLVISIGFVLSGWINTIVPVVQFGSLLFIGFVSVYGLKLKNQ